MEAQGFTNDTVKDREFFHFLVCHGAKSSVRVREVFHLFIVQSLAEGTVSREMKIEESPYAATGLLAMCITVQATLEELVCWPAMSRAVSMWATSRSVTARPSLYFCPQRAAIMSCSS
jgi:hypothetical protein